MRRFTFLAAAFVTVASCNSPGGADLPSEWETLRGSVFSTAPVDKAQISVWSGCGANEGQQLGLSEQADLFGRWYVRIGPHDGPLTVKARSESLPMELQAIVPKFYFGRVSPDISVNPITHLQAAYARYLRATGASAEKASEDAVTRINQHFGGLDFLHTNPVKIPDVTGQNAALYLSDAAKEAFILRAFEAIASNISAKQNLAKSTSVTWAEILCAAAEDIEADGVFDGVGFFGKKIRIHDEEIDGELFRKTLSHAIIQAANESSQATNLSQTELMPLARKVHEASSALFTQDATSFSLVDAQFLGCRKYLSASLNETLEGPQSGTFLLQCEWNNGLPLVSLEIKSINLDAKVLQKTLGSENASILLKLDTTEIQDLNNPLVTILFDTVNQNKSSLQNRVSFSVDNNPPKIFIENAVAWSNNGSFGHVEGTTNKPVRSLEVTGDGISENQAEVVLSPHNGMYSKFSVSFASLPCNTEHTVTLTATDFAGNQSTKSLALKCTTSIPSMSLDSTFFRADDKEEYISYGGEKGWPTEPVTFRKHASRLSLAPEKGFTIESKNLPYLSFRPATSSQSDLSAPVTVWFTYSVNDIPRSKRNVVSANEQGQYVIPISVETLTPSLNENANVAEYGSPNSLNLSSQNDLHRITVTAIDLAGNETSYSFPFVLDLIPPQLVLLPNQHRSDVSPDTTSFGDHFLWPQEAVSFTKLFSRLDYRPEKGHSVATQNLPYLKFVRDTKSVSEEENPIQVMYRYLLNGEEQTPFQRLYAGISGEYILPISYQTLLPAPSSVLVSTSSEVKTIMMASHYDDLHVIEIMAIDSFEKPSTFQFPFHLSVVSPTLFIRNCRVSDDASTSNFEDIQAIHEGSVPLLAFDVAWGEEEGIEAKVSNPTSLHLKVKPRSLWTSAAAHLIDQHKEMREALPFGFQERWQKNCVSKPRQTHGQYLEFIDNAHQTCFGYDEPIKLPEITNALHPFSASVEPKKIFLPLELGTVTTAYVQLSGIHNPLRGKALVTASDGRRGYQIGKQFGCRNEVHFSIRDIMPEVRLSIGALESSLERYMIKGEPTPTITVDDSCSKAWDITWGAGQGEPKIRSYTPLGG